MEITEMTLEDLEQMKNTLYSDFDNFWSYNVLKQELVNDKTKYIIAKEKRSCWFWLNFSYFCESYFK